jgi:uncharacterized protein (TIGR02611 family)
MGGVPERLAWLRRDIFMWVRTVQQAKRLIKVVVGFTLLLLGMVMWFTPGPGWAAVIGGLAILAAEFVWARRLLNKIKEKGVAAADAVLPRNGWLRRTARRFGGEKPEATAASPGANAEAEFSAERAKTPE